MLITSLLCILDFVTLLEVYFIKNEVISIWGGILCFGLVLVLSHYDDKLNELFEGERKWH